MESTLTVDGLDALLDAETDPARLEILALARTGLLQRNSAASRATREERGLDTAQRNLDDVRGTEDTGRERAREHWADSVFRVGTRKTIQVAYRWLNTTVADIPYYRGYRSEICALIEMWGEPPGARNEPASA